MNKRIIALILTVVLAVGSIGYYNTNAKSTLEEDNLKKMILLVKNKLDIGEEYTEFDYSYYEAGKGNDWYFSWANETRDKYISVRCDDEGHISSYSKNNNAEASVIPELTKKEVEPIVLEWIKQVEPEVAGKLKLRNSSYSKYNNSYRFVFDRFENDIPMPDNSVSITITTDGKDVSRFSENWNYTVSVPDTKGIMTKEEAAAIIKKNVKMELQYRLGWDEEGKEFVYLAYSPDKHYVAVNAKTGKVYFEKTYWNSDDEMFGESVNDATADSVDKGNGGATLTDAEIAKAEDIKGIITSDEAVELIKNNKYLYVGENINSTTSRLRYVDGKYYWEITMEDIRDYDEEYDYKDYFRAYAYATIDAATGAIISYYSNVRTEYVRDEETALSIKINNTKKQCRAIFEEFANTVIPEKMEAVKLSSSREAYTIYADYKNKNYIYGGYDYEYTRYNENVPFYSNTVSGCVDAVTGKVYEFNYNWTDAELPSTKGVIGASKAFDSYINYEGYDLVYELVNNYKDSGDPFNYLLQIRTRLVYRTAITPHLVDAFTGKGLNYNGQVYEKKITNFEYSDIEGSKYERVIRLLADMGVGLSVEKFEADKAITVEEFKQLLSLAGFGYIGPVYPVYPIYPVYNDSVISVATGDLVAKNGTTDLIATNPDAVKLTRQNAAKVIIEAMNMQELASLDIFKTGFADENKIDAANIGAVALMKGYEIMGAKKGNKFMPNAKITRGEAAEIVFKLLTK